MAVRTVEEEEEEAAAAAAAEEEEANWSNVSEQHVVYFRKTPEWLVFLTRT